MPTLATQTVDAKGHWLRADAAGSYLRMVAASGGLTGLVSAGRTRAEQQRLYDLWKAGKGNLAARPGTSLHESGLAIDVQTGSPLQRWMAHGSRYDKVTPTGTTRAADYGWLRTVPIEPWHFQYFPAKDNHKAVVVAPPKPTVTGLHVTTYNCLDPRFGGKAADDVAVLRKATASVYLLTECPEKVRDAIRAGMLGGADRWRVWVRVPQAIMFDSDKWEATTSIPVVFGPTSYHGGVVAVLTRKNTGQKVQFGSLHLPPSNVATDLERRKYLTRFIAALTPDMPTIIGGDFNSRQAGDWLTAAGFDVLPTGGTNDKGKRLDYLAVRNGLHWVAAAEIFNPGAASDHLAVKGKCRTVPATNTL